MDLSYFTNKKKPIIFEYMGASKSGLRMEEIVMSCKVNNTHSAFAFIDKTGAKRLPSADFLSMFAVVITTNQRFSNEYKNGSYESELKRKSSSSNNEMMDSRVGLDNEAILDSDACPLLKIKWLRLM